jgi:hypothetical protein
MGCSRQPRTGFHGAELGAIHVLAVFFEPPPLSMNKIRCIERTNYHQQWGALLRSELPPQTVLWLAGGGGGGPGVEVAAVQAKECGRSVASDNVNIKLGNCIKMTEYHGEKNS